MPHEVAFYDTAHLTFPEHVHSFIALQRLPRRFQGKEPKPRFDPPFDEAMILLNNIIEVLRL